jgi:hypothetical protein
VDLDIRSGDPDLLDDGAHESLTLLEVEAVDTLPNPLGETIRSGVPAGC